MNNLFLFLEKKIQINFFYKLIFNLHGSNIIRYKNYNELYIFENKKNNNICNFN